MYQYLPNACKLFRTWNMFSHRNNVVNIVQFRKPVHTAYVIHTYLRYSTNVCLSPDPEGMCAAKYAVMGIFSSIFWKENSPIGIFQRNYFWYLSLSFLHFQCPRALLRTYSQGRDNKLSHLTLERKAVQFYLQIHCGEWHFDSFIIIDFLIRLHNLNFLNDHALRKIRHRVKLWI